VWLRSQPQLFPALLCFQGSEFLLRARPILRGSQDKEGSRPIQLSREDKPPTQTLSIQDRKCWVKENNVPDSSQEGTLCPHEGWRTAGLHPTCLSCVISVFSPSICTSHHFLRLSIFWDIWKTHILSDSRIFTASVIKCHIHSVGMNMVSDSGQLPRWPPHLSQNFSLSRQLCFQPAILKLRIEIKKTTTNIRQLGCFSLFGVK
jgi:hypothetical protein